MERIAKEISKKLKRLETLEKSLLNKVDEMKDAKLVYTNKDVARMLGITTQTLRKLRESGSIGFSRKGNLILYTQHDIMTFMNTNRVHPLVAKEEEKNSK